MPLRCSCVYSECVYDKKKINRNTRTHVFQVIGLDSIVFWSMIDLYAHVCI